MRIVCWWRGHRYGWAITAASFSRAAALSLAVAALAIASPSLSWDRLVNSSEAIRAFLLNRTSPATPKAIKELARSVPEFSTVAHLIRSSVSKLDSNPSHFTSASISSRISPAKTAPALHSVRDSLRPISDRIWSSVLFILPRGLRGQRRAPLLIPAALAAALLFVFLLLVARVLG